MILTGYFDETGESTDTTQRANGIAGFIAPADVSAELSDEWNANPKLREFHDKKFRGIRRKENIRRQCLDVIEKYKILPVGWITNTERWHYWLNEIQAATNRQFKPFNIFGEPYYHAYDYCLRISVATFPNTEKPNYHSEVATVFDEKIVFFDNAMMYYRAWKAAHPQHERLVLPPIYRSSDSFAPLKIADCLAGILRDELIQRISNPSAPKLESYIRLLKLIEKSMNIKLASNAKAPIGLFETDEDILDYMPTPTENETNNFLDLAKKL